MRKIWLSISIILLAVGCFNSSSSAQQQIGQKRTFKADQIKLAKNGVVWARSTDVLFRTTDNGNSWQNITPPKTSAQNLSGAAFINENSGFVVLADWQTATLELEKTFDGGNSWTKQSLTLPAREFNLNQIGVQFKNESNGIIALQRFSSSNFTDVLFFATDNGGGSWHEISKISRSGETGFDEIVNSYFTEKPKTIVKINNRDFQVFAADGSPQILTVPLDAFENVAALDFSNEKTAWLVAQGGRCRNFKSDCEQFTRILATSDGGNSWRDVTPFGAQFRRADNQTGNLPEILPNAFEGGLFSTSVSPSLSLPIGSTRVSLNRGFDKCTAATVAQMQTWWSESPFYDANIYISGRNRGCAQPQLSAAWVSQVTAQGWGLIPTIVGYQAPCSVCTNCQKHSSDSAIAETQGRGEADIAIADANTLGLTAGTILYYDMERYDDLSGTGACSTPTRAFLKGWTDRLHEQGYLSGAYGSPTNANNDWINIPEANRMDAVWMARWNNNASVWGAAVAPLTDVYWRNHQRIHQYQAPANATWGGVTFNIDGNISDAPVAGAHAARNKPADFDGDGKSDVSVYRPETGYWYVLSSATNSFSAIQFGAPEDRIVPGDYDGDGKTDVAVFRPSTGTWYEFSTGAARTNAGIFRARQFGLAGDIPVAADYDGDGNTDLAVFRDGSWFITPSFDPRDPNFRVESFGSPGDLPVPGDYDNDGRADLAVFRPETGYWYITRSQLGFTAVQFGLSSDQPAAGDYDGDGRADIAVFRPETGVWYVLQSTAGLATIQFGQATDRPAPGDFDGDGKLDLAVYRPENGVWYLRQTQAGFNFVQFGASLDKPIPSGYIP